METKSLSKFKCTRCDSIPAEDAVNQCIEGHIVCNRCITISLNCDCGSPALKKIGNPLVNVITAIRTNCKYQNYGCTWLLAEGDTSNEHILECKYRPYQCIGDRFNIWKCEWTGPQHKLVEHMKIKHFENVAPFTYFQQSAVDFDSTKDISKMNLIDAFNKTFLFTYFAPKQCPNIYFFIFLLGRKSDAEKYLIDFELNDGSRKLKFIENCYNDVVDIFQIFAENRCFVISQKLAETYAKNGCLEFRFIIKKRTETAVETENLLKQTQLADGQVPKHSMGHPSVSMQNVSNNNKNNNNGPKRFIGGTKYYNRK